MTNKWFTCLLVFGIFLMLTTSCEKEQIEEEVYAELLFKIDSTGNKVYFFKDCDQLNIDTMAVENGVIYTFTGCGNTAKYFTKLDWHYNCNPVYDNLGYYLYDDCFWEYRTQLDIEKDSLLSANSYNIGMSYGMR